MKGGNVERVVNACKQHPWMAIAQTVTGAALIWVATSLVALNREMGELKVEIAALKAQVNRMEAQEDRRERAERRR